MNDFKKISETHLDIAENLLRSAVSQFTPRSVVVSVTAVQASLTFERFEDAAGAARIMNDAGWRAVAEGCLVRAFAGRAA